MENHSGTAEGWRRLVEELSRQGTGKFVVTVDGRQPVSVSRITNPFRLTDREDKRE
jgi:hypothetical protein